MIKVIKCECLECGGVVYLTKFEGMYAFCPMCGEEVAVINDSGESNQKITESVFIREVNTSLRITIRNQTKYAIDFVAGIKEEHTVLPDQEVGIEVEDGDYVYLDQVVGK